jgi:MerR family mercuric resistance operon transcriptional regulator
MVNIHPVVTTESNGELKMAEMSRSGLSKKTGVNGETIRYYEKVGLMPEPDRAENGYRIYTEIHVRRLSFIRRCRELGFPPKEIATLLRLVDGGDYSCAEVRDHALAHLENIDSKIQDLRKIQKTLSTMASKCDGEMVPDCPLVETLFSS